MTNIIWFGTLGTSDSTSDIRWFLAANQVAVLSRAQPQVQSSRKQAWQVWHIEQASTRIDADASKGETSPGYLDSKLA